MDYSELVKALRETATFTKFDDLLSKREQKLESLAFDAAAAIEELRKVNRELRELYEDAVRKLPNRGEWISVNPMVDSVQCSVCGGQLFSAELETPYCPYCGAEMEVQE